MNISLETINNIIYSSSLEISKNLEVEHHRLLRKCREKTQYFTKTKFGVSKLNKIETLENSGVKIKDDSTGDFKSLVEKHYKDVKGEERPYYELDKYQFMLYAMHKKGYDELKQLGFDGGYKFVPSSYKSVS